MIKKETVKEFPCILYSVDKNNTLTYYSKTKKGLEKITIPFEDIHISIQKNGNIKTGKEFLLNTLPGEEEISVKVHKITNVKGTCQGCCDGCEKFCYAIKGATQHHNAVLPSTIKNTILYRNDPVRFFNEIDEVLNSWKSKDHKVFRWHASGEIEDYNYLELMMKLADKHPEVHFYSYTKRFKLIESYLDKYNDFPNNFVWNLSVWGNNLEESGFNKKYLDKVQIFEWKDDITKEEYDKHLHCKSVVHNGTKKGHLDHENNCKKCGLCWKGKCKGLRIFVYNH